MKPETTEKRKQFDRKASKVIKVIGYVVLLPIALILGAFLLFNLVMMPHVRIG